MTWRKCWTRPMGGSRLPAHTEPMTMLVLTRKIRERILTSGSIYVRVLGVEVGRVKVGVSAPLDVPVLRQELHSQEEETFSHSE